MSPKIRLKHKRYLLAFIFCLSTLYLNWKKWIWKCIWVIDVCNCICVIWDILPGATKPYYLFSLNTIPLSLTSYHLFYLALRKWLPGCCKHCYFPFSDNSAREKYITASRNCLFFIYFLHFEPSWWPITCLSPNLCGCLCIAIGNFLKVFQYL